MFQAETALITTAISAGSSTTKVKLHDFQILGTQETIGSPVTYNNTQAIALSLRRVDPLGEIHFHAAKCSKPVSPPWGSHASYRRYDI